MSAKNSKWDLLKSSIRGRSGGTASTQSIHAHNCASLITRQKIIWPGWNLLHRLNAADAFSCEDALNFVNKCTAFMEKIDCAECFVKVCAPSGICLTSWFSFLTDTCEGTPSCSASFELRSDCPSESDSDGSFFVELRATHLTLEPFMNYCEYITYDISPMLKQSVDGDSRLPKGSILVYSREKSAKSIKFKATKSSSAATAAVKTSGSDGVPRGTMNNVVDALASHSRYGVDNTGQVRVWEAESLLLYTLLTYYQASLQGRHVLELGGGQTGVCGLGLAMATVPTSSAGRESLCKSVTITDGHPLSVANQQVCIELCKQKGNINSSNSTQVFSNKLRWLLEPDADLHSVLHNLSQAAGHEEERSSRKFDVITLADCLFFKEFHQELIHTLHFASYSSYEHMSDVAQQVIGDASAAGCSMANIPPPTPLIPHLSGGDHSLTTTVYLLQPRRGGTMDGFLTALKNNQYSRHWHVVVKESFCDKVTAMHHEYALNTEDKYPSYKADLHFPILIIITIPASCSIPVRCNRVI